MAAAPRRSLAARGRPQRPAFRRGLFTFHNRAGEDFFQLQPRVTDVAQALLRVFLEASPQQRPHTAWNFFRQRLPLGFFRQHRRQDLRGRRAGESSPTGEQLI
jgi:hypothetical protein